MASRAACDCCWGPAKPPRHFSEHRLHLHGVGLSLRLAGAGDLPSSELCEERPGVRLWEAQATRCSFLTAPLPGRNTPRFQSDGQALTGGVQPREPLGLGESLPSTLKTCVLRSSCGSGIHTSQA